MCTKRWPTSPYLVACEHIIRGAWRANSETGRKVSFFVLSSTIFVKSFNRASILAVWGGCYRQVRLCVYSYSCCRGHFPWTVCYVFNREAGNYLIARRYMVALAHWSQVKRRSVYASLTAHLGTAAGISWLRSRQFATYLIAAAEGVALQERRWCLTSQLWEATVN